MPPSQELTALLAVAEARRLAASGRGRAIRLAAGMSVGEVARAADTTHAAVSRWESQARRPSGSAGARWGEVLLALERHGFAPMDKPVATS